MRTNIVLDEALVAEAMKLTGITTKRAVIHEALQLLVETKRRRSLLELKGRVRFTDGYDHKALRAGER